MSNAQDQATRIEVGNKIAESLKLDRKDYPNPKVLYRPLTAERQFTQPRERHQIELKAGAPFWPMRLIGGSGVGFFAIHSLKCDDKEQLRGGPMSDTVLSATSFDVKFDLEPASSRVVRRATMAGLSRRRGSLSP